jgi:Cysteine-rich secretory protein family
VILVTAAILTVQSQSSSMLQSSYAQLCPDGSTPDASGNCPTEAPPAGDEQTAQAPPAGDEQTAQAPPATETPPPATEAPPAGASQGSNNTNFVNTILEIHNSERAAVGVPPLVWSDTIAASAQAWATHILTAGTFSHSPPEQRNGNGENIALAGRGYSVEDTVRRMVMLWVAEKQNYHGGVMTPENFSNIGHYTQMIWSSTTQIGCGIATDTTPPVYDYLVCQYAPPGNYMGQAPY